MANCTDPLVNDVCTVLLIHSDHDHLSTVFTDSGDGPNCPHNIQPVSNAVHSQCQPKYCLSSIFIPGDSSYLDIADHVDFTFPADFAYDFWIMTLQKTLGAVLGMGSAGLAGIGEISVNRVPNKLCYYYQGVTRLESASLVNDGCLHHIVISRSGETMYLLFDGVLEDTWSPNPAVIDGTHFRIGIAHNDSIPLFAFLDEFRVSKGTYRWKSDFSLPLSPYSYICVPPLAMLSGTVKQKGVAVQRTVRAYVRSTGAFYSETLSLADGTFQIYAPDDATEMFVIAFDDDIGDQYNALIYDKVKGITI